MRKLSLRLTGLCGLLLALLGGAGRAEAGKIVLAGDGTSVFYLTADVPNPQIAGNDTFYSNVLGAGTSVAVMKTSLNGGQELEPVAYFSSLSGVTASAFNGPITSAALLGVDLLLLPMLDHDLAPAEVAALSAFLAGGGTLFANGESDHYIGFVTSNAYINTMLSALGSTMSLTDATLDGGDWIATGSQIAVNPLTAGVTSYGYGSTSIVNGGTPLFYASGGQVMAAYEDLSAVPEPATIVLAGAGLGLLAFARRRRPRVTQ